MNNSKISVRYAKALFQTATQKGCQDSVKSDMQSVLECINTVGEFKILLESPVISADSKIEAFEKMFKALSQLGSKESLAVMISQPLGVFRASTIKMGRIFLDISGTRLFSFAN